MKKIFVALVAMLGLAAVSNAQGWFRQPTPNDTLRSTVILPDNSVDFQIYAPQAQSVAVMGDLPWDKPAKFTKEENGVWKGRMAALKDGVYRYRFLVDGVSVYDPKAPSAGETQALLTVAPKGDEFFAMKNVPHGAVAERYYWSEPLGEMRRLHVWTPAGYEKSFGKLPVLYLVHGGGDTDVSWPGVGAAGLILDNLMAEGKMKPMVVVMPNGSIDMPDGNFIGEVPVFAKDMTTSIIPFIEANYRVYTDQANRAMAGLSMGGMETLETTLNNPELFSYVWVLSASFAPGNKEVYEYERERLKRDAAIYNSNFKQLVFTQGGESDIAYNNCKETLKLFDAAGIKYEYMDVSGGHSWEAWRQNLYDLAQRIFTDENTQTMNAVENATKAQQFLKNARTYFIATVDADGQPRVRPFGTAEIIDGKLYIQTGKAKRTYKQLIAHPNAEICAHNGNEWIRIAGELIPDERVEVKAEMLEKNPSLKSMYKADDDNTIVFYFRNATATISSFAGDVETFCF